MSNSAGAGEHSHEGCYNGETTYYATENADNDSTTIITGMDRGARRITMQNVLGIQ